MNRRKRDFPKEILVKPDVWYKIVWKNDMGKHRGELVLGEADPATQTITLRRGRPIHETWITTAHEFLHAVEFEYELKIPHKIIYALQEGLGYLLRCWGF